MGELQLPLDVLDAHAVVFAILVKLGLRLLQLGLSLLSALLLCLQVVEQLAGFLGKVSDVVTELLHFLGCNLELGEGFVLFARHIDADFLHAFDFNPQPLFVLFVLVDLRVQVFNKFIQPPDFF